MRVYIAAVSGQRQYVESMIKFSHVAMRPGDEAFVEHNLRGNFARTLHVEQFLKNKKWDAMFMVDMDMTIPSDALERLRAHKLDIVGGHYYMRQAWPDPVFSIVRELGDGVWPFPFMRDIPRKGLHEVAMLGMGCVLISRSAMEAVTNSLPPGTSPVTERPLPSHAGGSYHLWGADFFFYTVARELGFKVWLDADIRCGHAITMFLDDDLYEIMEAHNDYSKYYQNHYRQTKEVFGVTAPKTIQARIQELTQQVNDIAKEGEQKMAQINQLREDRAQLQKEYEAARAIIAELQRWLGGQAQPQVTKVDNLPILTDEDVEQMKEDLEEPVDPEHIEKVRQQRETVYAREAGEHIEALDARPAPESS